MFSDDLSDDHSSGFFYPWWRWETMNFSKDDHLEHHRGPVPANPGDDSGQRLVELVLAKRNHTCILMKGAKMAKTPEEIHKEGLSRKEAEGMKKDWKQAGPISIPAKDKLTFYIKWSGAKISDVLEASLELYFNRLPSADKKEFTKLWSDYEKMLKDKINEEAVENTATSGPSVA